MHAECLIDELGHADIAREAGQLIRLVFGQPFGRREIIDQQLKQKSERAFGELQQRAAAKDVSLLRTSSGLALAPMHDGKAVPLEEFGALPEAERNALQREIGGIQGEL